jgi:hypothetical protein
MSLTIPFRVFGKYHFIKLNDDMIYIKPHTCPYFNDAFPDKQFPDLLSNTLINYCKNCCENDNMEQSHIALSLCGLGKEDIINTFIDYDKQIETSDNIDTSLWKSALFICPNCHHLYYNNNLKGLMENIQKTNKLNEIIIPYPYQNLSEFVSFDTDLFDNLIEKYNNELKAFYANEINEYLNYILTNVLQFNIALTQMHQQMQNSNLSKITFSLSFIWFTKPFYTSECTFSPPLNKSDYHTLYDTHLFNYIKGILPELVDINIKYPELDDTVKNMNISNNTELGVEFTLQF